MVLETGSDIGWRESHGRTGHKESLYFTTVNGHNRHTRTLRQTHAHCIASGLATTKSCPLTMQLV